MTPQERQDAIDGIRNAQELINEALGILDTVVRQTGDRHAEAYIVDHLKILAGEDHGFLSCDYNLDKWIEDLESEGECEDEDEQEETE